MTIAWPTPLHARRTVPGIAVAAVTLAMVVAAIWPALVTVSATWSQDEYSHAWLIPPLALLLFIYRFRSAERGGSRWPGLVLSGAALILMLAGWATRNTTLSIYGLIAGAFGLTTAALGLRALGRLAAPLGFLVFIIPLPLAIYISLSQSMQLLSSRLGVLLIRLVGVVVTRDGSIIELASGRLEVAEACSGLRYLFPLLSIAFLIATLVEDRWWKKAVLFVSAIPIAIVLNAVRVAMIGILVDRFGMAMAEGLQHEVEGFLVFALCVALLAVETQILLRIGAPGRLVHADALLPNRRSLGALRHWPTTPVFAASAGVLAAGALLLVLLPVRAELIPARRPLALFPMTIAGWQGRPHPLDAETLGALGLTDYVMADYTDPQDGIDDPVNFYVAYYETQKIGVQVHSPRLCIPGGGWTIMSQASATLSAADGSTIPANRVMIQKNGTRQLVYYWFEERGRRLTEETAIKLYALLDAVTRNRSDGALVRLVVPITDGDEDRADRALQALVRAASGQLGTFVPG